MAWFQRLCRQAGLLVHKVGQPGDAPHKGPRVHEVSRRVEQRQVNESVTLRRTTIEEIEVNGEARDREDEQHQERR